MPTLALSKVLELAKQWPEHAQDELAAIATDIDAGLHGGQYRASPEELAGIERGLADARAGRFAPRDEIDALLAKNRGA